MTDINARSILANARRAADEYLARKVADGEMTSDVAKDMRTVGFTAATRTLSTLRSRNGMGEQAIADAFQKQLDAARAADDTQRVIAAEFTLAVWDGLRADLAEYLGATG
jgi:phage-related tail fiber protein